MRYQCKGIAGKWNIYNEEGLRVGRIQFSLRQKLELRYGGKAETYQYIREKDAIRLEQNGIPYLAGVFQYPIDDTGNKIQKSPFRPPMPTELKIKWKQEDWSLRQLPSRTIEIYRNSQQIGSLGKMAARQKILEWNDEKELTEKGFLCIALGIYLSEDDTIYIV